MNPYDTIKLCCGPLCAECETKIETLTRELAEARRAIESLTPEGSEFHNDPKRCLVFVRDRISLLNQCVRRMKEQRDVATERAEKAEAERDAARACVGVELANNVVLQEHIDKLKAALDAAKGGV